MKNIVNIALCLLLFAGFAACKSDDMNFKDVQVTPVANLYEPFENKAVKLISSSTASVYFEWEPAKTEDSGAAIYELVFDKVGGDFSQPIYKMVSNNNGFSSNATVLHKQLNAIALLVGIGPGETGDLIWTVIASRGINQVRSMASRKLTITSLQGFADIPNELFVTGEGSEGGADAAAALAFKQTAAGEFEIYTQLDAEKIYAFVDRRTAAPRTFYTDDQVKLKELSDENTMKVAKTGVYKINVDFNVATISFVEIKSMGLWFSPDNKVALNLPYQGKGIWSAKGVINFKQEGWGRDQRYKFQMEVVDAGKALTQQFGAKNSTDSAPNASSDPSYYYLKQLANVSQWDDKWKLNDAVDGKATTISVLLQGDKEYTHSVL